MFNYYAMKYGDYVLAGFGISQKDSHISDRIDHRIGCRTVYISKIRCDLFFTWYTSDLYRSFYLNSTVFSSFFAAGAGLLTGIFQAEGKGMPAVIMSVTRGLVLIPAIVIGNQLFQLNGVVFSLLVSEAISCMMGCVMYYLIRSKWFMVF